MIKCDKTQCKFNDNRKCLVEEVLWINENGECLATDHLLKNLIGKVAKGEIDMFHPTPAELKNAAKPLVDILYKYYHPHASVIVNQTSVEVVEGVDVAQIEPRDYRS